MPAAFPQSIWETMKAPFNDPQLLNLPVQPGYALTFEVCMVNPRQEIEDLVR